MATAVAEAARFRQILDGLPINVMTCDPKTFVVTYANKATIDTLRKIEHLMPIKADQLVGTNIDIFHKHPEHQRRMLSDPRNLPHRAKIKLGSETLDLKVSAIQDTSGNYVAAMLYWSVITQELALTDTLQETSKSVSAAAIEVETTAQSLSATAEETLRQAQTVSTAAQQTAQNTQSVAAAAEELTASVTEISRQVAESTRVAAEAAAHAEQTNEIVDSLAEAAKQIDSIVSLIKDIAGQTNLLALNATIEAARAGEAGKGFAVVAGEVKSLAKQTATATEDIARRVGEIQSKTHSAVGAIGAIAKVIGRISEISSSIAAAVEEQSASTNEINQSVQFAANAMREVSSNVEGVTRAASETGSASGQLLGAAKELATQSDSLKAGVDRFLQAMDAK